MTHIELDLFVRDSLLFADGHVLKTSDGSTPHVIAGSTAEGYVEGHGSYACFNRITGFIQLNSSTVVAVDSFNHCLRLVDRVTNSTQQFLGNCTNADYRDGEFPLFNQPWGIFQDRMDPEWFLVTDKNNNALRNVSAITWEVSTSVRSDSMLIRPNGITQHTSTGDFYLTTEHGVVQYDYASRDLTVITGSTASAFKEGLLSEAMYNTPTEITYLTNDQLLLADMENSRLRVLDLQSNNTWSICSATEGYKDGSLSACELYWPSSLLETGGLVYIGQFKRIRVLQPGDQGENLKLLLFY